MAVGVRQLKEAKPAHSIRTRGDAQPREKKPARSLRTRGDTEFRRQMLASCPDADASFQRAQMRAWGSTVIQRKLLKRTTNALYRKEYQTVPSRTSVGTSISQNAAEQSEMAEWYLGGFEKFEGE